MLSLIKRVGREGTVPSRRFACIGAGGGVVELFWVRGCHVGFGLESGRRLCHTVGFYCEMLICLI